MVRLLAPFAIVTSFLFAALIFLIMPLGPATSVLAYRVPVPDRQEEVWLMDVRSGLSYFSSVTYRAGTNPQWEMNGNAIVVTNYLTTPTQYEIVYLNGRAPQIFPLQTVQPNATISPDGTKMIYRTAEADGSLNLINLLTGEESTLISDVPVVSGLWMPDGEHILVFARPDDGISSNAPFSLYLVNSNTADVTLLFENIDANASTMRYDTLQLIYIRNNSELMIASPESPDEPRTITIFETPTVRSVSLRPEHEDQVIVITSNEGTQETWLVDIESGERELLHEFESNRSLMLTLRYSEDGDSLVKLMVNDTQSTTVTISKEGQPEYDITIPGEFQIFDWSPDGRYLMISTVTGNVERAHLLDTADGSVRELDRDILFSLMWQPETG